jgi:hypothetical protein
MLGNTSEEELKTKRGSLLSLRLMAGAWLAKTSKPNPLVKGKGGAPNQYGR